MFYIEGGSVEKYIGRVVEIIYLGKKGEITQRKVNVQSVQNGVIRAYCLLHKAPRIFKIENILAIQPVGIKHFGGSR